MSKTMQEVIQIAKEYDYEILQNAYAVGSVLLSVLVAWGDKKINKRIGAALESALGDKFGVKDAVSPDHWRYKEGLRFWNVVTGWYSTEKNIWTNGTIYSLSIDYRSLFSDLTVKGLAGYDLSTLSGYTDKKIVIRFSTIEEAITQVKNMLQRNFDRRVLLGTVDPEKVEKVHKAAEAALDEWRVQCNALPPLYELYGIRGTK
jgi:nitrogen regulatory protein PII-like uncharacterized protein